MKVIIFVEIKIYTDLGRKYIGEMQILQDTYNVLFQIETTHYM